MRSVLRKIKGQLCQCIRVVKERTKLSKSAKYDLAMYKKHARVGSNHLNPTLPMLEALLIKTYHVIEKGLSMPEFRPRFGEANIKGLWRTMERYLQNDGRSDNAHFVTSAKCMQAYCQRHDDLSKDISDIVSNTMRSKIDAWCNLRASVCGGVIEMSPDKLFEKAGTPFLEFSASRISCRHFDRDRAVAPELIEDAVRSAIRTPSVCNRQPWRVHAYYDRETIEKVLECQNGNRGFGQLIPCVLLVSVDLSCFEGSIERYQSWIDGGMFSMTLIYALHALSLGAVALNWSASAEQDIRLRNTVPFPDSERIIMLVGVGHPEVSYLAPVSQRRDVSEILFTH